RAEDNEVMDEMKEEVFRIINRLVKLYDLKIDSEIDDEGSAAIIIEGAKSHLNPAIIEELGKENIQARFQTRGADDFHFYTLLRPHLKATMLALGADVKPGLHDPNMTFNKGALTNGVNILTNVCLTLCHVERKWE